jgi:hypothetical protein
VTGPDVGSDDEAGSPADRVARDRIIIDTAWAQFGGVAAVSSTTELSPMVSTNRVYRVHLDDGRSLIAKVSSYGSYFLFSEDHDRIHRVHRLLHGGRFAGFLADCLTVEDEPFRYYDGTDWLVFYDEVPMGERLPRILDTAELRCLGHEIGAFHKVCAAISSLVPPTSTTIKSDAIHLLQLAEDRLGQEQLGLTPSEGALVARHAHEFCMALDDARYDYWPKQPVFIDWNLGNFSVQRTDTGFELFSRWDYDWFRVDVRHLDFYFLSRVSSETGDRTRFSYGGHTLLEPGFVELLRSYVEVNPLQPHDLLFLREAYRFFLLNYVVRDGARFFRSAHHRQLRRDVLDHHFVALDSLDLRPLVDQVL